MHGAALDTRIQYTTTAWGWILKVFRLDTWELGPGRDNCGAVTVQRTFEKFLLVSSAAGGGVMELVGCVLL